MNLRKARSPAFSLQSPFARRKGQHPGEEPGDSSSVRSRTRRCRRPATSQRSGMCCSWATLRRWHKRSSDKTTRRIGEASIVILGLRSAGGVHVRFRELTRFCGFRVCSRRWVEKVSIEVANFLDESEPSGKADLSVVGVPGFSGLVSGSSASVGVHDRRSVIMDGGSVNRGIMPAEAQHPISTIGHGPCG